MRAVAVPATVWCATGGMRMLLGDLLHHQPAHARHCENRRQIRFTVPLAQVSVDPQHDTPEVMAAALAKRNPRLVGLTQTKGELARARRLFRSRRNRCS